jgi:hypothetical protein
MQEAIISDGSSAAFDRPCRSRADETSFKTIVPKYRFPLAAPIGAVETTLRGRQLP